MIDDDPTYPPIHNHWTDADDDVHDLRVVSSTYTLVGLFVGGRCRCRCSWSPNLWAIKINLSINISIITPLNYNSSVHPPHSDHRQHHRSGPPSTTRSMVGSHCHGTDCVYNLKGAYANEVPVVGGCGGSYMSASAGPPNIYYMLGISSSSSAGHLSTPLTTVTHALAHKSC